MRVVFSFSAFASRVFAGVVFFVNTEVRCCAKRASFAGTALRFSCSCPFICVGSRFVPGSCVALYI